MLKRKPEAGDLATSADTFGELLKDLRDTAGMSQAKLAAQIPCDRSQIARIEAGTRVPQKNLVETCDELLETGGLLIRLWRRINWYPVVEHPDWFKRRAAMDAEAVAVREYGTQVIPGLLQTEEYIRTLFSLAASDEDGNLNERVKARLSRQHRYLNDPEGPLLVVVLDESCIRRVVGGPAVMRDQCERLLTAGKQPNIRIQVVPFTESALTPATRPMSLITLPDGEDWVYSESLDRGHFTDDPKVLARHSRTYDVLRADALSASNSAALISEAMEGYGHHEHPRPERRKMGQKQLQRQQRRKLRRGGPRLHGHRPRS
ncbi:helix-turn-helix domain-containing protein [Streptomyces sp. NBC_01476]|uniref:helix-turn-helix domain-containing protein n=1 Tax=Streptomyces sp. NBC_01476 TaxID=2903881 RepID=UPI002E2F2441|nr:helix-turn-helix transcriptional regulator [Streptomyces sp. NBC_01476]